ncbi:toprim domain-containing protein [Paracoccus sp. SCSIO 75233]|uniref:DUF7146 domain-containing protein n=1 Tax=Paracoccus sp. SCSIO 75233 TaxID=3017782 RepID=UPI0022F08485|nr:toprim domain-containing protein [Paracoccus sp. SCSIO 75233]WBU52070.1 toprim domain-containing protein [Paracoccus sp. SCSIO 75233]
MTDAQTLTHALKGKWYRRYGVACCPAHGDNRPSLSLADGTDGKLLLNCKSGCSFTDILQALRDRGLLDDRPVPPDPAEIALREAEERAEAAKREKQALSVWREAQPIGSTIAETYLRNRGITCDLPDSLRFHPECWHGATAQRAPAMIARVDGLPRFAVHRTYLRPDGDGKADLTPNKAMLGKTAGGAVCVCDEPGPLVVAEGIATALSLSSGLIRRPATVWAALSAPGIAALHLPDKPQRLTIASDGDTAGREAANRLAERATALGWTVSLLPAPEGRDWNDILQMKGAA